MIASPTYCAPSRMRSLSLRPVTISQRVKIGVAAVETRYGQDVHHGRDDRQEGALEPEIPPVPVRGEDAADGDEAAHLLVHLGLGLHDQLELLPVGGEHGARTAESRRYRLGEACSRACRGRLVGVSPQDADAALVRHRNADSGQLLAARTRRLRSPCRPRAAGSPRDSAESRRRGSRRWPSPRRPGRVPRPGAVMLSIRRGMRSTNRSCTPALAHCDQPVRAAAAGSPCRRRAPPSPCGPPR